MSLRPRLDLPDGAGVTEPTLDEIGDRLDALGLAKLAHDNRGLGFCTAAETPVLRHLDALVGHLERRSEGLALAEAERDEWHEAWQAADRELQGYRSDATTLPPAVAGTDRRNT